MEINIFQVDAFSKVPFGGNPAGVVTNSKKLNDKQMQRIANEMNLSETAFINQMEDGYFKIRYFTPLLEVDLCGHATIASIYTLASEGFITPIQKGVKTVIIETKAGKLNVDIEYNNYLPKNIIMAQKTPQSLGVPELIMDILDAFGLEEADIGIGDKYISPEIISTGLPDIIFPIKDKKKLVNMKVDFCKIAEISRKLNVTGVHAFYIKDRMSRIAYARNFAPIVGIDEEAATGTANGALIYYLKKNDLLAEDSLVVSQGDSMGRPSQINCRIENSDGGYSVFVGGEANIVIEGIIKF
ncbi:MAG: PhzF family phenazine biosynthesis protein [Gudongella sp.]|nr:PhzF family phenazine biosynthesis protein [Gudongella sp.]